MNGCQGGMSACNGLDPRPVRVGLRREVLVFCAGCRAVADGMGLQLVERRVASVPVARDRRRFVPAWITNLRGRDETGRLVA